MNRGIKGMEKINVVVLLPCDTVQMGMLQEAGADRCEFQFLNPKMSTVTRLGYLQEADIIIGEPTLEEIKKCPYLRWVQMSFSGADMYMAEEEFPKNILLTNAKGCYRIVIAEYVIAVLLALCRNLKGYTKNQFEGKWARLGKETLLFGKRALILGAGDIGTGLAKRLKAFNIHITGMRRTERNYPDCYDAMITLSDLDRELSNTDIVVGCLPDTPKTRGMLDERRLRLMKKDAFLVNVGRGSLIDLDALVKVLKSGSLAGVALDVTTPEPLPKEHPLWNMDRVILTPHIAGIGFGASKDTENRIIQLCCQNLERYLLGKELLNRVSLETGYASE